MSLNGSGKLLINLIFCSKKRRRLRQKSQKNISSSADYRNFPRDGNEKHFLLAHSFQLSTLIMHKLLKGSDSTKNIAVDFDLAHIVC